MSGAPSGRSGSAVLRLDAPLRPAATAAVARGVQPDLPKTLHGRPRRQAPCCSEDRPTGTGTDIVAVRAPPAAPAFAGGTA